MPHTNGPFLDVRTLPEYCFAIKPDDGTVVGIKRGEHGFVPMSYQPYGISLEKLNEGLATPQQVEAMLVGSMFGWTVPGANPDSPYYAALTWSDMERRRIAKAEGR